jgi:hypothetical protein
VARKIPMPHRSLPSRDRSLEVVLFGLLAASPWSCHKPEPEAPPAQASALQQAPAAPAPPEAPSPAEDPDLYGLKKKFPREGWSSRRLQDALPLCVFPSSDERVKAQYLKDVRPQKLSANSPVFFGVFPLGCLNEKCDARPLIQCSAEQQGNTLVVSSHFFAFNKDGSDCTQAEECMEVDSSCPTPVLKAGKYTVRYGAKTFKLQIPSVLKDPCFTRE